MDMIRASPALAPEEEKGPCFAHFERLVTKFVRGNMNTRYLDVSHSMLRQGTQDFAYGREYIDVHLINVGSYGDGLAFSVCNDHDYLLLHRLYESQFSVKFNSNQSVALSDGLSGIFFAEPVPQHPAYMKLACRSDSHLPLTFRNIVTCFEGKTYLDSDRFIKSIQRLPSVIDLVKIAEKKPDCPALTRPIIPSIKSSMSMDIVFCLPVKEWPDPAKGFITRSRLWPSKSIVANLVSKGCHLVGKQHPTGTEVSDQENHFEWTFAFSAVEKDLVHSLSKNMASVLYVIKSLKSELSPPQSDDEGLNKAITSYIIKTSCLWAFEKLGDESEMSMMDYTRTVIDFLLQAYKKHFLPHYFIPEENLIRHIPSSNCQIIAEKLVLVASRPLFYIISKLHLRPYMKRFIFSIRKRMALKETVHDSSPRPSSKNINQAIKELCENLSSQPEPQLTHVLLELEQLLTECDKKTHELYLYQRSFYLTSDFRWFYLTTGLMHNGVDLYDFLSKLWEWLNKTHESYAQGKNDVSRVKRLIDSSIGDLYGHLFEVYRASRDEEKAVKCMSKADECHEKCKQCPKIDIPGKGCIYDIGGLVHYAFFQYLCDNDERALEALESIVPHIAYLNAHKFENATSVNLNVYTPIKLLIKTELSPEIPQLWKRDVQLKERIPKDEDDFTLHPVCLSYYIRGRIAFKAGDNQLVTEYKNKIERLVKAGTYDVNHNESFLRLWAPDAVLSSKVLVETLRNL